MKTYYAKCPCCGQWNNNLLLEETEGWFECEKCGQVSRQPFTQTDSSHFLSSDYHSATSLSLYTSVKSLSSLVPYPFIIKL